ncbi:hypothetical protein SAMN05877809_1138 [Rhodobacter sp. JA431]|nr:hypothetical protein SAMN05877809_1138 [Rhodobacter sp. JA431]
MRATVVVETDPVADDTVGVLDAIEAVAVTALLLDRPDDALQHAVLLRAMRGDELVLHAIAAHQRREVATGKNQAIVRPHQEFPVDPAKLSEPADQGVLEHGADGRGLAGAGQVPA